MRTRRTLTLLLLALVATLPLWAVSPKVGNPSQLKVKGDVLMGESRYSEALEYYTAALEKAKAAEDMHTYNACIGNISNIYAIMGDPQRSLYYQKQGYESSQQAGDSTNMRRFAVNIVAQYCLMGDVENAKAFFRQQMQLSTGDADNDRYYNIYNQGMIAQTEGNLDQAAYYFQAALNYATEHNMEPRYALMQIYHLGSVALQQNQHNQAINYFLQEAEQAQQAGIINQVEQAYRGLAKAYKHLNDSVNAARYKAMAVAISDTLYDRNRFSNASGKLFEYENAENQRHIDSLVSRNHTQLLIILGFAALLVALTLLYMALRRKNRSLEEAQRLLVSKNEELIKSDRQNRQLLQHYADGSNKPQQTQEEPERNDIGLTQDAIDQLLNRINSVMQQVDVISSSDFNLNQLAQLTDSNTKYVSWVINDVYGKNFKTFLNEHRIREACRRLSDTANYGNMTIQAIYEQLGYQSAASFITAFKKSVGMTPSIYQRLSRSQQPTPDQEPEG